MSDVSSSFCDSICSPAIRTTVSGPVCSITPLVAFVDDHAEVGLAVGRSRSAWGGSRGDTSLLGLQDRA